MQNTKYCIEYRFIPNKNIKWLFVIFIDKIKEIKLKEYEFLNGNKLFIESSSTIDKETYNYHTNKIMHHILYTSNIEYNNIIVCGDGQGQDSAILFALKYRFKALFLYTMDKELGRNSSDIEEKLMSCLNDKTVTESHIFKFFKTLEPIKLINSNLKTWYCDRGIGDLKKNILSRYMEYFYEQKYEIDLYINEDDEKIEAYLDSHFKDIEVAFYIFKDNEKAEVRWYSSEPYLSYMKQGQGVYKIAAFIKCELGMIVEEKAINCLSDAEKNYFEQLKSKNLKRYIDIHGSCVSRDLFNFSSKGFEFSKTYCARTSIFACLSNSNTKINKDYIELESKFRRRSLEYDLDKNVFTTLQQGKGNYLIIDLVDTVRFVLMKYEDSLFTGSTEFVDSKLSNYYNFERINPLNFSETEWKYYFSLYSKEIKKLYDEKNIIIHCVYFKNDYRTIDGQIKLFDNTRLKTNKIYNEVLEKWYTYLRKILPNAIYIDICKQREYLADEKHHYGLAPVHYNDEYYLDVLKQLEEVLECNQ